jgi:hypothetical protein
MTRFFDTNYLFENFGGTFDASSSSNTAYLSFDEDRSFSWTSSGESTDGDSIYLERILDASATVNRIFVKETNINNLTVEVDIGAGYVALSSASTFTLIKSNTGYNYFYELDNSINLSKIKLSGSNTIITNQEKTIKQVYAFQELGRIKNNDDIQPKRSRIQAITKLNSGKVDIVNKGLTWEFKLKLKSHYKSEDNSILNTVLQRSSEMWLWLNDDTEDSMVMIQEPWNFGDLYKVTFQKADSPRFDKNMYFSGVNIDINLIEVA